MSASAGGPRAANRVGIDRQMTPARHKLLSSEIIGINSRHYGCSETWRGKARRFRSKHFCPKSLRCFK